MRTRSGFTLLEMVIVIGIIGMLIGGILVGKDILRSAQLRAATSEMQNAIQNIKIFQTKYGALPGDMSNATAMWSSTANGNGDGRIVRQDSSGTYVEQFTAWQHLSRAKLMDGSFTGAAGSGGNMDRVPGSNIPASRIANGGWGLVSITIGDIANVGTIPTAGNILYVAGDIAPNHVLWLGGRSTVGTNNLQAPVLRGDEAEQLDRKFDDSFPGTGKIVVQVDGGSACYSSNTVYVTTSSNRTCALIFKTGF